MTNSFEQRFSPLWKKSIVTRDATLRSALQAISNSGSQMACFVSELGQLDGLLTDSDIRQALLNCANLEEPAFPWANQSPITASLYDDPEGLTRIAEEKKIREIPLLDSARRLADIFVLITHKERRPVYDLAGVIPCPEPHLPNTMLILAGGLGTRLKPIVNDRPKPLAMVGNRPLIETVILQAASSGIKNFKVATNYQADKIEGFLSTPKFQNLNIEFIRETKRLGTAGAIGLITDHIDMPMIVTNADILTTFNFSNLLAHHVKHGSDMTCAVRMHNVSVPYGVVEVRDRKIARVLEKPQWQYLVSTGIYVINPAICRGIPNNEYLDMPDLITKTIAEGRSVSPYLIHEYWIDVGHPESFQQANEDYSQHFEKNL